MQLQKLLVVLFVCSAQSIFSSSEEFWEPGDRYSSCKEIEKVVVLLDGRVEIWRKSFLAQHDFGDLLVGNNQIILVNMHVAQVVFESDSGTLLLQGGATVGNIVGGEIVHENE